MQSPGPNLGSVWLPPPTFDLQRHPCIHATWPQLSAIVRCTRRAFLRQSSVPRDYRPRAKAGRGLAGRGLRWASRDSFPVRKTYPILRASRHTTKKNSGQRAGRLLAGRTTGAAQIVAQCGSPPAIGVSRTATNEAREHSVSHAQCGWSCPDSTPVQYPTGS